MGTAVMVTATVQRPPHQQRHQQAEDAGQHHDGRHMAHIQGVGERCGASKPQDRAGRDQSDANAGADHPPTVHRQDEAAAVHRCAIRWPALVIRLVTRWQGSGIATLIMEPRGL
jgi:hypothetical protein